MSLTVTLLYLVTSCEEPMQRMRGMPWNSILSGTPYELFLKKQYFRKEMMESHLKEMKEILTSLPPLELEDKVWQFAVELFYPSNSARSTRWWYQARLCSASSHPRGSEEKGDNCQWCATCAPQDAALVGGQTREQRYWKPPVCWKCNMTGHMPN